MNPTEPIKRIKFGFIFYAKNQEEERKCISKTKSTDRHSIITKSVSRFARNTEELLNVQCFKSEKY